MRKRNPDLANDAVPVARKLHGILSERGLHHVAVSQQAGLGRDYLRDLFRGKSKNPKADELVRITKALAVGLSEVTEKGTPLQDKLSGDKQYTRVEVALLDLWGLLSDVGRDEALGAIAKLITLYPRRQ